jgi:polyhydroxyalkanoate synthase
MLGLGPDECDYSVTGEGPHWRLRSYSGTDSAPPLLIVAAPIKRPYIWDLAPSVSAIRYCLARGFRVHLVEWTAPSRADGNEGLDEYADAITACAAEVAKEHGGDKPIVIGHSLGGTLAAIAVAVQPEKCRGLVLLGAPLCFAPGTSRFRDTLAKLEPSALSESPVVPGSFLSQLSAMASPETFLWSRYVDAALSLAEPDAAGLHARVERWVLDEAPLPGKLVYQVFQWLYRENRLCRGELVVKQRTLAPSGLHVPTLAVVNRDDDIAPLASVKPFLDALATHDTRVIEHPGETGVALQHLAILVGRRAHAQVWPEIVKWLRSRC